MKCQGSRLHGIPVLHFAIWKCTTLTVCWEKQPRTKVHQDFNKLLQQTKGNQQQKHPLCFIHHFYRAAVSIDRTCIFPVRFFEAEIHIHTFYTLLMAGLGAGMPKCSRMDPSCCLCSPELGTRLWQTQVSLQHTVHRPSVPAKLLQTRRQNVRVFLPCSSPVS